MNVKDTLSFAGAILQFQDLSLSKQNIVYSSQDMTYVGTLRTESKSDFSFVRIA